VDCTLIEPDLVSFHFGGATDISRAELEAHLQSCPRCLGAFFTLKRAVEDSGEERPSSAAQVRLREAVAREFVRARPRTWLWGGAAAAVVVAAALLGFFTHTETPPQPLLPAATSPQNIDSARPEPLNLDFI
jgi:Putative zinc-finger